ncbi:MAG: DUF2079 domain-containing protein [Thermoplasmatales archaeon]|nr:DUF2079 domain-containing protein [Thermoplasmatales archaeon]MCW6170303.1 DUF2079 domain-containing protein [Thermoplasmatales archaeon]
MGDLKFHISKNPYLYTTISISLIFSIIFSFYTVTKYLSLNASAFDLGLEAQIYATTMHGEFFYTSLLGESYLAEHFSPIVFLIYPIYYFFPSPETLLILQSFVIGFSAIPLFLLSTELMKRRFNVNPNVTGIVSVILSTAYLLSPYTESPLSFDFHLMPFLIFLVPLSYYLFLRKRWLSEGITLALIVALHSAFVIMVIFILLSQLWIIMRDRKGTRAKISYLNTSLSFNTKVLLLSLIATAILYFILAPSVKVFIATGSFQLHPTYVAVSSSPSHSLSGLITLLFTNPKVIAGYLFSNYHYKIGFAFYAFAGTGFICFLDPVLLITTIPYFVYSYFSFYLSYYQLGYQYSAMLIPFVFVITAFAISRTIERLSKHRIGKILTPGRAIALFIVLILAGTIFEFPMTPLAPPSMFVQHGTMANFPSYHYDVGSKTAFLLQKEIGNGQPYLLTTNNIFPVFSNDKNAYADAFISGAYFKNMICDYKFEYLVNQPGNGWSNAGYPSLNSLASNTTFISHYGILMRSFGPSSVIVYKLNYSGPTLIVD